MRRGDGITSLGWLGWKERMRAVEAMEPGRCGFFDGVLDGVGNMVAGSIVVGAAKCFEELGVGLLCCVVRGLRGVCVL